MCLRIARRRECCNEKVQICALVPCSSPDPNGHCIKEYVHPRPWRHRCPKCQVTIAPNVGQPSALRPNQTTAQRIAQEARQRRPEGRLSYPENEETHSDATEGLPGGFGRGDNTPPRGDLGPLP